MHKSKGTAAVSLVILPLLIFYFLCRRCRLHSFSFSFSHSFHSQVPITHYMIRVCSVRVARPTSAVGFEQLSPFPVLSSVYSKSGRTGAASGGSHVQWLVCFGWLYVTHGSSWLSGGGMAISTTHLPIMRLWPSLPARPSWWSSLATRHLPLWDKYPMHFGPEVRTDIKCHYHTRAECPTGGKQGDKNESVENDFGYWSSGVAGSIYSIFFTRNQNINVEYFRLAHFGSCRSCRMCSLYRLYGQRQERTPWRHGHHVHPARMCLAS